MTLHHTIDVHVSVQPRRSLAAVMGLLALPATLGAHTIGDPAHDGPLQRTTRSPVAAVASTGLPGGAAGEAPSNLAVRTFGAFAPAVRVRTDGTWLVVESNGLPAHGMMVGITAWQQQVPLPQPYAGANGWRLPLRPQPAAEPVSIRDRFLRGAIALAANGIPIFNPQNNRGEVSFDIGELDHWGGHCGRSDDYHYHIAPLHLQDTLGRDLPIAFALDGYPIFGLTEPSGTKPEGLDRWNGHETAELGYHYHASATYPFVNGGFHGIVTEREGQVDPQPRARGVRPALTALRGAEIVGFSGTPGMTPARLDYILRGRRGSVAYTPAAGDQWEFRFTDPDGTVRDATYRPRERGGSGPRPGDGDRTRSRERVTSPEATPAAAPPSSARLHLESPAVGPDGVLPVEYTGDGAGLSPPLTWGGAPAGTRSFAVIMEHLAPDGEVKCYWTLYNLPPEMHGVPKDVHGAGALGHASVGHRLGYAPPHSKGPGLKTYVITLYALSSPVNLSPEDADRSSLLAAIHALIIDRAELRVTHTRSAAMIRGAAPSSPPGDRR